MDWMVRSRPPRQTQNGVIIGTKYHYAEWIIIYPGRLTQGLTGKVSKYAWGRDYHNLISKSLKLCQSIQAIDPNF